MVSFSLLFFVILVSSLLFSFLLTSIVFYSINRGAISTLSHITPRSTIFPNLESCPPWRIYFTLTTTPPRQCRCIRFRTRVEIFLQALYTLGTIPATPSAPLKPLAPTNSTVSVRQVRYYYLRARSTWHVKWKLAVRCFGLFFRSHGRNLGGDGRGVEKMMLVQFLVRSDVCVARRPNSWRHPSRHRRVWVDS
jgi:hypothetical protein